MESKKVLCLWFRPSRSVSGPHSAGAHQVLGEDDQVHREAEECRCLGRVVLARRLQEHLRALARAWVSFPLKILVVIFPDLKNHLSPDKS